METFANIIETRRLTQEEQKVLEVVEDTIKLFHQVGRSAHTLVVESKTFFQEFSWTIINDLEYNFQSQKFDALLKTLVIFTDGINKLQSSFDKLLMQLYQIETNSQQAGRILKKIANRLHKEGDQEFDRWTTSDVNKLSGLLATAAAIGAVAFGPVGMPYVAVAGIATVGGYVGHEVADASRENSQREAKSLWDASENLNSFAMECFAVKKGLQEFSRQIERMKGEIEVSKKQVSSMKRITADRDPADFDRFKKACTEAQKQAEKIVKEHDFVLDEWFSDSQPPKKRLA